MDCIWVNLKIGQVDVFSNYLNLYETIVYNACEIIRGCYVAVVLQMKTISITDAT